jgi:hypothetical protein
MIEPRCYRLYRFDGTGHITGVKELDCGSDMEALELARKLANSQPQELWSREKLLAVVRAQSAA